ncbi:hypothetical protein AKO1_006040 [Acrasis kona]|uniref:Ribosomal RNA-processing protein 8 n=1 Tax=Acrasis kona TaxID=1008807 RepID=A0AAW2YH85_9EUKA
MGGKKKVATKRKYDDDRGTHFFDKSVFKKRKFSDAEVVNNHGPANKVQKTSSSNLTELQQVFKKKLEGAKFRFLNEKLYTITGEDAKQMFDKEPKLFTEYHDGYRQAVDEWPFDPVKSLIKYLSRQPKSSVVADFGCGEARIAQEAKQKVHSFDLVALNEHVTVAEMSNVPLEDESVDIAIFCLSLMGTNFADYIKEANRVLKQDGTLKIAELESRLIGLKKFLVVLEKMGFAIKQKSQPNGYFYIMEFKKTKKCEQVPPTNDILKPCLYKKR